MEFGQFVSVTWLNLLRRLGFGQTPPPVGTPAQIWAFFFKKLAFPNTKLKKFDAEVNNNIFRAKSIIMTPG